MFAPLIGEIRMFAVTPQMFETLELNKKWVICDGRSLPIKDFEYLYAIIGTTYGGGGSTFNVPDMRGCAPMGTTVQPVPAAQQVKIGQKMGENSVTLTPAQIPFHTHTVQYLVATSSAGLTAKPGSDVMLTRLNSPSPTNSSIALLSAAIGVPLANDDHMVAMAEGSVGSAGSSTNTPHENRQPFSVFLFAISYA